MSFFSDFIGRSGLEDPLDLFGGRALDQSTQLRRQLSGEGLDLQRELFEQLFQDRAPVLGARNEALGLLQGLQDGSFNPFLDPSLKFRQEENERQIQNQLASEGRLNSGQRYVEEQDSRTQLHSQAVSQALQRILNLAGYSTGDLASTNPVLQNNLGTRSGLLEGLGRSNAADILNRRSGLNYGVNQGANFAGYYFG